MDEIARFAFYGGRFLIEVSTQSLLFTLKKVSKVQREIEHQYDKTFNIVGRYDSVLELFNDNFEVMASNPNVQLAFISDRHKAEFEKYLKTVEQSVKEIESMAESTLSSDATFSFEEPNTAAVEHNFINNTIKEESIRMADNNLRSLRNSPKQMLRKNVDPEKETSILALDSKRNNFLKGLNQRYYQGPVTRLKIESQKVESESPNTAHFDVIQENNPRTEVVDSGLHRQKSRGYSKIYDKRLLTDSEHCNKLTVEMGEDKEHEKCLEDQVKMLNSALNQALAKLDENEKRFLALEEKLTQLGAQQEAKTCNDGKPINQARQIDDQDDQREYSFMKLNYPGKKMLTAMKKSIPKFDGDVANNLERRYTMFKINFQKIEEMFRKFNTQFSNDDNIVERFERRMKSGDSSDLLALNCAEMKRIILNSKSGHTYRKGDGVSNQVMIDGPIPRKPLSEYNLFKINDSNSEVLANWTASIIKSQDKTPKSETRETYSVFKINESMPPIVSEKNSTTWKSSFEMFSVNRPSVDTTEAVMHSAEMGDKTYSIFSIHASQPKLRGEKSANEGISKDNTDINVGEGDTQSKNDIVEKENAETSVVKVVCPGVSDTSFEQIAKKIERDHTIKQLVNFSSQQYETVSGVIDKGYMKQLANKTYFYDNSMIPVATKKTKASLSTADYRSSNLSMPVKDNIIPRIQSTLNTEQKTSTKNEIDLKDSLISEPKTEEIQEVNEKCDLNIEEKMFQQLVDDKIGVDMRLVKIVKTLSTAGGIESVAEKKLKNEVKCIPPSSESKNVIELEAIQSDDQNIMTEEKPMPPVITASTDALKIDPLFQVAVVQEANGESVSKKAISSESIRTAPEEVKSDIFLEAIQSDVVGRSQSAATKESKQLVEILEEQFKNDPLLRIVDPVANVVVNNTLNASKVLKLKVVNSLIKKNHTDKQRDKKATSNSTNSLITEEKEVKHKPESTETEKEHCSKTRHCYSHNKTTAGKMTANVKSKIIENTDDSIIQCNSIKILEEAISVKTEQNRLMEPGSTKSPEEIVSFLKTKEKKSHSNLDTKEKMVNEANEIINKPDILISTQSHKTENELMNKTTHQEDERELNYMHGLAPEGIKVMKKHNIPIPKERIFKLKNENEKFKALGNYEKYLSSGSKSSRSLSKIGQSIRKTIKDLENIGKPSREPRIAFGTRIKKHTGSDSKFKLSGNSSKVKQQLEPNAAVTLDKYSSKHTTHKVTDDTEDLVLEKVFSNELNCEENCSNTPSQCDYFNSVTEEHETTNSNSFTNITPVNIPPPFEEVKSKITEHDTTDSQKSSGLYSKHNKNLSKLNKTPGDIKELILNIKTIIQSHKNRVDSALNKYNSTCFKNKLNVQLKQLTDGDYAENIEGLLTTPNELSFVINSYNGFEKQLEELYQANESLQLKQKDFARLSGSFKKTDLKSRKSLKNLEDAISQNNLTKLSPKEYLKFLNDMSQNIHDLKNVIIKLKKSVVASSDAENVKTIVNSENADVVASTHAVRKEVRSRGGLLRTMESNDAVVEQESFVGGIKKNEFHTISRGRSVELNQERDDEKSFNRVIDLSKFKSDIILNNFNLRTSSSSENNLLVQSITHNPSFKVISANKENFEVSPETLNWSSANHGKCHNLPLEIEETIDEHKAGLKLKSSAEITFSPLHDVFVQNEAVAKKLFNNVFIASPELETEVKLENTEPITSGRSELASESVDGKRTNTLTSEIKSVVTVLDVADKTKQHESTQLLNTEIEEIVLPNIEIAPNKPIITVSKKDELKTTLEASLPRKLKKCEANEKTFLDKSISKITTNNDLKVHLVLNIQENTQLLEKTKVNEIISDLKSTNAKIDKQNVGDSNNSTNPNLSSISLSNIEPSKELPNIDEPIIANRASTAPSSTSCLIKDTLESAAGVNPNIDAIFLKKTRVAHMNMGDHRSRMMDHLQMKIRILTQENKDKFLAIKRQSEKLSELQNKAKEIALQTKVSIEEGAYESRDRIPTSVHNDSPVNVRLTAPPQIIPKATIWNPGHKPVLPLDKKLATSTKTGKQYVLGQIRFSPRGKTYKTMHNKKSTIPDKKYRYEMKPVVIGNRTINITYLVEDD